MSESMEGYDYDMRSKQDPRCTVDLKMYHEVKTISEVLYRSKELFTHTHTHEMREFLTLIWWVLVSMFGKHLESHV